MLHRLTVIAAISFPSLAVAQSYWETGALRETPEALQLALYTSSPEASPDRKRVVEGDIPELTAAKARLEERFAPLKIYTFSASDPSDRRAALQTSYPPGSPEDRMIRFIQRYEAGTAGYDAVWAGSTVPLPRPPTQMTVCEVRDWQIAAATRQKSTAIGLYQFVGDTLRRVLDLVDLPCGQMFDAKTQDQLGMALLFGRGWQEFKAGAMSIEDFGYELAGEWAAFPAPFGPDRGYSRYRGIAGNRHLVELPEYMTFLTDLRRTIAGTPGTVGAAQGDSATAMKTAAEEGGRGIRILTFRQ